MASDPLLSLSDLALRIKILKVNLGSSIEDVFSRKIRITKWYKRAVAYLPLQVLWIHLRRSMYSGQSLLWWRSRRSLRQKRLRPWDAY